jgi:hypothetical protein
MQPEWSAFVAHIERLSSESQKGLVELMEDQCLEASRLLENMEGEVGALSVLFPDRSSLIMPFQVALKLRNSCYSYLAGLKSPQGYRELFSMPLSPFPWAP